MFAISRKIWRRRIRASLMQLKYGDEIRCLRYFGLFIGYPRSGHTLVAALLDAHPRMVFANGLDATLYLSRGLSVSQVAALAIWNSQRFTRHGRRSNGYQYAVPNSWHGRWNRLDVIGDKSGDLFSYRLRQEPGILSPVLSSLSTMGRFVHVIRNPYDCIASISRRNGVDLRAAAADFLSLCEVNARARETVDPSAWLDVYLEDLVRVPAQTLHELCRFFGLESNECYEQACRQLIFRTPLRSSADVPWDTELLHIVGERIAAFPWMNGYGIENPARYWPSPDNSTSAAGSLPPSPRASSMR
jgi:sulfotransferase family protein